jgi:hypothetical protein
MQTKLALQKAVVGCGLTSATHTANKINEPKNLVNHFLVFEEA